MKVRTDFVTNSSSSSFVILLKEEDYLKVLPEMTEDMIHVVGLNHIPDTVFGTKVLCFRGTAHSGEPNYKATKFLEGDLTASEVFWAFEQLLEEHNTELWRTEIEEEY